jgi:hypothetical protein
MAFKERGYQDKWSNSFYIQKVGEFAIKMIRQGLSRGQLKMLEDGGASGGGVQSL